MGRKAREVNQTLFITALTSDSVENKAKEIGILLQTVRNYVEEQPDRVRLYVVTSSYLASLLLPSPCLGFTLGKRLLYALLVFSWLPH